MHEISLLGMRLEGPLMNAAGTCKTTEEVRQFAVTPISAVVVGSYTYDESLGNSGTTYYADSVRSINSKGIPNGGRNYVQANLPEMVKIAHGEGKPLIASVQGNTPEQFAEMAEIALAAGADAVEVNLACPNLWSQSGEQKRIVCFYPEMLVATLDAISERVPFDATIAAKLTVYSNPVQLAHAGDLLNRYGVVSYFVDTNTFANAFGMDPDGKSLLGPEYGGMAGSALKFISLGQVRQLRAKTTKPIVGAGGISSGQDVLDYLRVGATAVQVATAYFQEGFGVFSRILHEYTDLVPD